VLKKMYKEAREENEEKQLVREMKAIQISAMEEEITI
jgi:hypothetical protein